MLKLVLVSIISLLIISCSSNKVINKTQKNKIFSNPNNLDVIFIFYKDISKESLLISSLIDKFSSLNYKAVAIPVSKLNQYSKCVKTTDNKILLSLGESLFYLDEIIKYDYKFLIIDTPEVKDRVPKKLNPDKTLIMIDHSTILNGYKLIDDKNYRVDLRYDKYAWLLNKDSSVKELLVFANKKSKLSFIQKKSFISFNDNLENDLVIFFTKYKSFIKKCNKKCNINDLDFVKSVYKPINKDYYISKDYINRSLVIKKIFTLINNKEYLDSYLLLLENKNIINFENFKKIFDFIEEPLYNLEPEIEKFKTKSY